MDKTIKTPHPLGFNDAIYHEGSISRLTDKDVFFSFRYSCKVTNGHMVNVKIGI